MKTKILITLIGLLLCHCSDFAQGGKNTYFLKNNGKRLNGPDSADYVMIISKPDSGSLCDITEYYMDKTVKLKGKTIKPDDKQMQGECKTFYHTGQVREIANFKYGNKQGDSYVYYPNGKLYTHEQFLTDPNHPGGFKGNKYLILECRDSTGKVFALDGKGYYTGYDDSFATVLEQGPVKNGLRNGMWQGENGKKEHRITFIENYNNGELTGGKAADSTNNKTYTYIEREHPPRFQGGVDAFGKYLGQSIKYPHNAKINKIQGRVVLQFVVEADGSISNLSVLRSPDDELSAEALRVIKQSPNWEPGLQYGVPVRVSYVVPISFSLN